MPLRSVWGGPLSQELHLKIKALQKKVSNLEREVEDERRLRLLAEAAKWEQKGRRKKKSDLGGLVFPDLGSAQHFVDGRGGEV